MFGIEDGGKISDTWLIVLNMLLIAFVIIPGILGTIYILFNYHVLKAEKKELIERRLKISSCFF